MHAQSVCELLVAGYAIYMIYKSLRNSDRFWVYSLLPLVRTNNLRVHAREMVVDGVLLRVGLALRSS